MRFLQILFCGMYYFSATETSSTAQYFGHLFFYGRCNVPILRIGKLERIFCMNTNKNIDIVALIR